MSRKTLSRISIDILSSERAQNWAAFRLAEKDNLRDVEITKVNKWAPKCPNCGRKMTFMLYEKGPPIENEVF
nr:hypothetical protein BSM_06400 [uncultured archaeon]